MDYGEIISQVGKTVGAIGGIISLAELIWRKIRAWKDRGTLEIDLVRLEYHLIRYPDGTGPRHDAYGPPGGTFGTEPLDGRSKSAFTILEFQIRNTYPHTVAVGRIEIDDWIYSEEYHIPMYGPDQNYRVFNLFTRERVSLAPYQPLPVGQSIGRRVEIIEKSVGPSRQTHRQRVCLPEREAFVLRIACSEGTSVQSLDIPDSHPEYWASVPRVPDLPNGRWSPAYSERFWDSYRWTNDLHEFSDITRWSGEDLIPGREIGPSGEPRP